MISAIPLAAQPAAEPEGSLVLLGGGQRPSYVMDRIVELAGGRSARILVVPLGHPRPEQEAAAVTAELEKSGAGKVELLAFDRDSADDWETLERVDQASGVFFAGGSQSELAASLRHTLLWERIRELYTRGGVVAGESAGATVLGTLMVTAGAGPDQDPDRSVRSITAGGVAIEPGLDLLPNTIVDQHFLQRRRQNRLLTALLEHPELLAIGIDEATAIVVDPHNRLEVLGEGLVVIYDLSWGSQVETDHNGNLGASGITLNLLRPGQRYDLGSRGVQP